YFPSDSLFLHHTSSMALVRATQQTSSSNTSRCCRYHVFLSFRGEDTRKTFTDHLFRALVNAGFRTFRDDDELERGEDIKPELQKAIKQSRTSVIVFSKDYASSRWCLDELMTILERKRTSPDYVVLPVFYDVKPSHVRNQTGSLAKAFARHQKTQPSNKVKEWREALAEVADLAGMVLQNQADGCMGQIMKIRREMMICNLGRAQRLRDMRLKNHKVCSIFQDIRRSFWIKRRGNRQSLQLVFISNLIRELISKVNNSIYRVYLDNQSIRLNDMQEFMQMLPMLFYRLRKYQNIININNREMTISIKNLIHNILEFTRSILNAKRHNIPLIMSKRSNKSSLISIRLSNLYLPESTFHIKLRKNNSFIKASINNSSCSSCLVRTEICLRTLQHLSLQPNWILGELSWESEDSLLTDSESLTIVSFSLGSEFLNSRTLIKLSFSSSVIFNCLIASLTLQSFAYIFPIPRCFRPSFLRRIFLFLVKLIRLIIMSIRLSLFAIMTFLTDMTRITVLVFPRRSCRNQSILNKNIFIPPKITQLWTSQIAQLIMYSRLCMTWCTYKMFNNGTVWISEIQSGVGQLIPNIDFFLRTFFPLQYLRSLKILDLSHSHSLTETIDFSYCPNLEKLILVDCTSLIYVHGSIGNLERLIYLNMKDCKKIRMLPKNICMLKSLETFIISGCSNLKELSIEMLRNMDSLKVLEMDRIPISELWLERRSSILGSLPCSLVELSLLGCNLSDDAFPMDFSNMSSLQRLNLGNNPICSLPNCIKGLARLDKLSFSMCTSLKSLLGLPKVNNLDIVDCISLEKITYKSHHAVSATSFSRNNLVEWQDKDKFKLPAIESVDVERIGIFRLCNLLLESMAPILQKDDPIPVQGLYECGIFSTFFGGNEVPGQFSHKSRGSSISFTVPLLDNHRTRGLIVFVVYVNAGYDSPIIHHNYLPHIRVKNKSKGLRGGYGPSHYGIPGEGEDMIWLSHWSLENDQLQGGDEVVVSVIMDSGLLVKELGIRLVQVQQEENHNMMSISTDSSYDDQIWYNKRLGDSDEEYTREEVFSRFVCLPDKEEEQQDDITVATTTGSNNSGGLRGWKVLVTAACFFLTLSLITRSSLSGRKKGPSTSPG
ncbi:unnamed protein product, partial [Prunus brigantina]